MDEARQRPLKIVGHDDGWAARFASIGVTLRVCLDQAALRIDHIGSTAVRGLAAKDVIDIQATVAHLDVARDWPYEILPGLIRRPSVTADHLPLGIPYDADEWAKLYWSDGSIHLHVREEGRLNLRYPLLFRDYLRADAVAAGAYGLLKCPRRGRTRRLGHLLRRKGPRMRPDYRWRRALGRKDRLDARPK
ncbi:MAG: GrpB family protein [Acidimicrobiia bacterium]